MSAVVDTLAPVAQASWDALNAEVLSLRLRELSCRIRQEADTLKTQRQIEVVVARMDRPPAIDRLCARFDLDEIERDIVLLALLADGADGAASPFGDHPLCRSGRPTPALAMALHGMAARDALSPDGQMRRLRLLYLDGDSALSDRTLRLPDAVAWYLRGEPVLSQAVRDCASVLPKPALALGRAAAVRLGGVYVRALETGHAARFGVVSQDGSAFLSTLHAAMSSLDRPLVHIRMGDVPQADRVGWGRELARDIGLTDAVVVLDVGSSDLPTHASATAQERAVSVLGHVPGPAFVVAKEAAALDGIGVVPLRLEGVNSWADAVADLPEADRKAAADVARIYPLDAAQARRAVQAVATGTQPDVWHAARAVARASIGALAERVESRAGWDDLILPPAQMQALHQMSGFLHQRDRVACDWGYAGRSSRGLGMAALFHGPSGTGKTTAAEILVREMSPHPSAKIDLYRVDVSTLISKYIGETSKNMAAIFEAGAKSGAALLFDEAEGLFARRSSSGRDSQDKNSNAELGYLLQCLENYPGIAILTTNMRNVIDDAFLRRFRFVIEFPFPDRAARERIWRSVIPAEAPTATLDYPALSRLSLSGGNIRSIAINAAFAAAAGEGIIDMAHLATAARYEFGKLDKPAPESDLRHWVSA